MDLLKENIFNLCNEIVEENEYFLVDLIIRGDQRNRIIEVYVDSEKIVSAEDLTQLSREINDTIAQRKTISGPYRLDVSTPGVDRPLKYLRQFPKHINRNFEISYKSVEEIITTKAKLISIEGNVLTFLSGKNNLIINFSDLTKAKVIISFS